MHTPLPSSILPYVHWVPARHVPLFHPLSFQSLWFSPPHLITPSFKGKSHESRALQVPYEVDQLVFGEKLKGREAGLLSAKFMLNEPVL